MTAPTDPALLTIAEARRLLAARALSAVELTTATLDRIAALNPALNAYLRTDPEAALAQARAADRRVAAGGDGDGGGQPLLGIPVCVKDVVDVLGTDTTAGSAGWRRTPTRDAGAARRLREAGAILLANGNTNEFAYGIDGLNPHRGDCRNPYDPARMSGGSSSGPAVATATGMALGGLGTDTTGSIRVPASLCGLAGIRPTLGLVSRAGVVPLAWSYDTVGPLARTVDDVAILLGAVAGHDPNDPTSADRPAEDYRPGPDPDVRGLRLGLVEELVELTDAAVAEGVAAAADHLATLGAEIVPLRVDLLRHAPAIHRVVQHAESARVHEPWFGAQRDRYAPPVRVRIEAGRGIPATAYLAAQQARRLLVEDVARSMRGVDAMLAPTAAVAAPPRDAAAVTVRGRRVPVRDALLGCVLPISQLGCPAASVAIGDDSGLPFGLQVVGRPFAEALVLRVAAACERRRPWADHRPSV